MNENSQSSIHEFSMQEEMLKQPVIDPTFPEPEREHIDRNEDVDQQNADGENASFRKNKIKRQGQRPFISKEQRAQILRQRAGLLTDQPPRKHKQHNKWGNFLVIHDNPSFSITLGPDYWCFIPTFICFAIMGIGVLVLIFTKTQSWIVKAAGVLVCGGELLSYLLMATSNPGIAREKEDNFSLAEYENPQKSQPMKMCTKCGFSVPRSSFHCRDCDLCILGYDHHCPWTSKCIGENNLCRFYTFLSFTPIFFIFISVAFILIMSDEPQITHKQNIRNLFEII